MSARREKRLRKLEARVAYLDGRVRSVEKRQHQEEMYFGIATAPKAEPKPDPPRRSLWHRLLKTFST